MMNTLVWDKKINTCCANKKQTQAPPQQHVCAWTWRRVGLPSRRLREDGRRLRINRQQRGRVYVTVEDNCATRQPTDSERQEVLQELSTIIDPDLGLDIVQCGFVKNIELSNSKSNKLHVNILLQLTTPACPVKEEFKRQVRENLQQIPWIEDTSVEIDSSALPKSEEVLGLPEGLRGVRHIVAVSSCKGGVGKSSVSVNLAYALTMMGAKVGIFDADVYGPSLPIMVSPEKRVLEMDPETKSITPVEYKGVKLVSFGFTTQGSAIMRGPMVSGLVNQLLTTTQWGDLDYLVIDFPPGTGDIQLTLGQAVPISAAVIVTTPQKLAFADVAKGIRMFAKLQVPCVSVVENMSYFEADGKRYHPFGKGSGDRIQTEFSIPSLLKLPIVPEVSSGGDEGCPAVISDPKSEVAKIITELGAQVVKEIAKMERVSKPQVRYDEDMNAIVLRTVDVDNTQREISLSAHTVRENDQSAKAVDEWTGRPKEEESIPEDIRPESISCLGNYAIQISWNDGFNQIAPFEQLIKLDMELKSLAM